MTIEARPTVSIREVASAVATGEVIEDQVAALAPDLLFPFLIRLDQIGELVGKFKRALEKRMSEDGWVGQHFTADGKEYAFAPSSRGDFADPRALFADLMALGVPPLSIAEAVSKVKVTTLRDYAATITDEEKRAVVLETVEDHRVKVQGAPRLIDLDNKYRQKAVTANAKQKEGDHDVV